MSQNFMVPGSYNENIAYVEDGDTASRNYSKGNFITWHGVLHSVTAAISSGETFVLGTNVKDESVGGLAEALSDHLAKQTVQITQSMGTWPSGVSLYRDSNIEKIGRICCINLNLMITDSTKHRFTISGVVPVGYRPLNTANVIASNGDADGLTQGFSILSNGDITFWNNKTGTTYLIGSCVYFV